MSLKKIANMTGLSIATVSHALNGTRAVSQENRELAQRAAKELGYRPNLAGRMLRTQRSSTIAIVIPSDINNQSAGYFYMDVIMGVREKLKETEYELIVSTYDSMSSKSHGLEVQALQQRWIDGIIIVPSADSQRQVQAVEEIGVPFVLLDRQTGDSISCVTSSNAKGARDAVYLLYKAGKRRIGFIGGAANTTGQQRKKGYMQALAELGLSQDDTLMCLCKTYSYEMGEKHAKYLLQQGTDGIFIADNTMTMAAMRYLKSVGTAIPDAVGIVGFDDFDWMDLVTPPITTVKQRTFQMGYVAAEMLLQKFQNCESNDTVVLDTELIIRASHGHIN